MWPILFNLLRTNAPLVMLPVSLTVGFIGYQIESRVRGDGSNDRSSTIEKRSERNLDEIDFEDPNFLENLTKSSTEPEKKTIFFDKKK